jgi:hypothetical protein
MMNKLKNFMFWVFRVTYQDSTIKHKNIADNSIFFISFLYSNLIGFIINSIIYIFDLYRFPPYFFLGVYVTVFISSRLYFVRDKIIKSIEKNKPTTKEVIKLNLVFVLSAFLFFGSLALVYAKI